MPQHSYFAPGEWNFACDICGLVYKSGQAIQRWDGAWCCQRCWTPRQPQDFVRVLPDDQSTPWSRNWRAGDNEVVQGAGELGTPYLGEGTLGGP